MQIAVAGDSISDDPPEYNVAVKLLLPSCKEATLLAEYNSELIPHKTTTDTQIESCNEIHPRTTKNCNKFRPSEDVCSKNNNNM